ncbi:MAG: hypothetical protein SO314_02265, partial [Alphaproteobacteria bacterium]|nr:hypothetical protein [Alphaproteobacteria bacterium]
DNARACQDTGYVNTCPSGQKLKKNSGRCSYDSSYGTCCKPSGCPSYTSLTSSSYGTNGTDGCEYTCYYTCDPNCPSSYPYSSDPTGCSSRTTNGCGNKSCYNSVSCDPCPGYYSCGGTWQYCTGTTCSDGSKRCSNYCVNDYFPNSCSNSSYCNGVYRNGYCSGSCNPPASSGPSGANTQDCPNGYYRKTNADIISIHNGEEAAPFSAGEWCFPLADRWLDSQLTNISRRLVSVFQMRGTYNFTGDPYINEIEYSNGTTINGNMSVGNIYAHSGTITFNGHVTVLNTVLIASGANVYFNGGVTFRGYEVGADHCSNNWKGWGDSGSGRCNISGTRYY